jgi:hypothetical protein
MDRWEEDDTTLAQVLFRRRNLKRGSPARELEPTVTYRLGVDLGGAGGQVPGRSPHENVFLWLTKNAVARQSKKISCG